MLLKKVDTSKIEKPLEEVDPPWPFNHSLYLFGKRHWLRVRCNEIVNSATFDSVVLTLIVISVLVLVVDGPRTPPDSSMGIAVARLNIVLTIAFTIEMTVKIIALTFVATPTAYIRLGWNVLDFCIVVATILASELRRPLALIR